MLRSPRCVARLALSVAVLSLTATVPSTGFAQTYTPVTIDNCGVTTTYAQPPQRALTLNSMRPRSCWHWDSRTI